MTLFFSAAARRFRGELKLVRQKIVTTVRGDLAELDYLTAAGKAEFGILNQRGKEQNVLLC